MKLWLTVLSALLAFVVGAGDIAKRPQILESANASTLINPYRFGGVTCECSEDSCTSKPSDIDLDHYEIRTDGAYGYITNFWIPDGYDLKRQITATAANTKTIGGKLYGTGTLVLPTGVFSNGDTIVYMVQAYVDFYSSYAYIVNNESYQTNGNAIYFNGTNCVHRASYPSSYKQATRSCSLDTEETFVGFIYDGTDWVYAENAGSQSSSGSALPSGYVHQDNTVFLGGVESGVRDSRLSFAIVLNSTVGATSDRWTLATNPWKALKCKGTVL